MPYTNFGCDLQLIEIGRHQSRRTPQEIEAAILQTIESSFGDTEEEIIQSVARAIGYQVKSALPRQLFMDVLKTMKERQVLSASGDLLVLKR